MAAIQKRQRPNMAQKTSKHLRGTLRIKKLLLESFLDTKNVLPKCLYYPLKNYKMAAIQKCNVQIWHRTLQNILDEVLEQLTKK